MIGAPYGWEALYSCGVHERYLKQKAKIMNIFISSASSSVAVYAVLFLTATFSLTSLSDAPNRINRAATTHFQEKWAESNVLGLQTDVLIDAGFTADSRLPQVDFFIDHCSRSGNQRVCRYEYTVSLSFHRREDKVLLEAAGIYTVKRGDEVSWTSLIPLLESSSLSMRPYLYAQSLQSTIGGQSFNAGIAKYLIREHKQYLRESWNANANQDNPSRVFYAFESVRCSGSIIPYSGESQCEFEKRGGGSISIPDPNSMEDNVTTVMAGLIQHHKYGGRRLYPSFSDQGEGMGTFTIPAIVCSGANSPLQQATICWIYDPSQPSNI